MIETTNVSISGKFTTADTSHSTFINHSVSDFFSQEKFTKIQSSKNYHFSNDTYLEFQDLKSVSFELDKSTLNLEKKMEISSTEKDYSLFETLENFDDLTTEKEKFVVENSSINYENSKNFNSDQILIFNSTKNYRSNTKENYSTKSKNLISTKIQTTTKIQFNSKNNNLEEAIEFDLIYLVPIFFGILSIIIIVITIILFCVQKKKKILNRSYS